MKIEQFLQLKGASWMDAEGELSDIVLSTRIRLARNLKGYRFPTSFSQSESEEIEHAIMKVFSAKDTPYNMCYFAIKNLSSLQRQILIEKHLISPTLAKKEYIGSIFLTPNEHLSVLVNEEDHIRIQYLAPGLDLQIAHQAASDLNDYLSKQLPIAYDHQFGYLTSCPTNIGTGLRASVMVHLPALTMLKRMNQLIHTLTRLGMTVRGIYGEGSDNLGNVYQISNQVTLGKPDSMILDELEQVIQQIVEKERLAREELLKKAPILLEDRIFRSLGTIQYARILSSEEAAACLSNIRFGVDLGLIKQISVSTLNECMILVQPGFIQQYAGTALEPAERDLYRAKILQKQLLVNDELTNTDIKGDESYDV